MQETAYVLPQSFLFSTQLWWIIAMVGPLILGIYAHMRITNTYKKYVQIPSRGNLTGAEAAAYVMRSAGIEDVDIVQTRGHLDDHYDPSHRRLALSPDNYNGTSLAALGVAAHEAGHAIQHKQNYLPLHMRMGLVPMVNFAGQILPFVMFGGFFFGAIGGMMLDVGILCYLAITVFHLVTLPVEFDASNRAKKQLAGLGIIQADEAVGVRKTLDAAGFTYVASFLGSVLNLVYLVLLRNSRD